jgi:hypothetical protein
MKDKTYTGTQCGNGDEDERIVLMVFIYIKEIAQ